MGRLAKLGTCCLLILALALASVLAYIITQQAIEIGSKRDQTDQLQHASAVLICQQICRNTYEGYNNQQGDTCCNDAMSSCVLKTICRDDYVSRQRLQIKSMLSNLYFQCAFLAVIAVALTVFMCYKCKKRRQQSLINAANNLQGRIQSMLHRMNHCNQPLLVGSKDQLNPSYLTDNIAQSCPICLEQLVGRRVIKLECGHVFHSGCIEQWVGHNAKCPVCRTSL